MNKFKIISYTQIFIIILIVILVFINLEAKEIIGYKETYIYKMPTHLFTNTIIDNYEDYKTLMKDNDLKVELDKNFFTSSYLYVHVETDGICTDDDENEIETSLCFDSNELKVYKYISCFENCKKDDIIYMVNVSKNVSLNSGDLKITELKKYKTCD